jgi:dolichol-phosphate mannosyltransferase
MPPGVWLVLPTFNEAENIEPMVAAVLAELESCAPGDHRLLIVDDSSPDGTGELAERLAAAHEAVEVLHRSQRLGLGPAYLAGFQHALDGGATHVFEMDADFSHDPSDLHRLLDATRDGADLALGSRYVPGGGVEHWGLLRQIVSRGGCAYARAVLRLQIHDLTGGFKCFRREVLESIHLGTVRSHGYCFQIELTQRAIQRGFAVVEVPIVFRERRHGRSKMSPWIALEAFVVLPQMRWRRGFR